MTKIPGAVILLPVLVFHYRNIKSQSRTVGFKSYFFDKRFLSFALVFSMLYVLGAPGIIIKFKGIIHWLFSFFMLNDTASQAAAFPHLNRPESLLRYYLNVIFPLKYITLNILIWGGMILSFKWRNSIHYLFFSFLIPYFFFLCTSKSTIHIFPRYILPLIPFLFIYTGIFLENFAKRLAERPYTKPVIPILIIIAILPVMKDTIAFDRDLKKPDTRTLANAWIGQNVSPDSIIIIEGRLYGVISGTAPLKMKPALVDEIMSPYFSESKNPGSKAKFYEILKRSLTSQKTYHLILTGNRKQLLDALNNGNVDYVILRQRALKLAGYSDLFPDLSRLISWVNSDDFQLIKVFEPDDKTTGPKLLLFKKKHT